ncbi:terminase small subunit [Oceanobacillus sp. Castelsardo]|uniref:terminase small subunit n=1 Tax=Oceanobacillus sp. Castelsardo TaxID=1851204 RepID=UPI000838B3D3|nr:terminase small subunit [Oceanobacillus sp. Castelsardo]
MPNWDEIRKEWETTKFTLAKLAEKHDVKLGTLKSRKSREGWSRGSPKKDATKTKKDATPKKKVATKSKKEVEPIVESDELTDKQRLFCIYYIKYFNATKAYQKAYECAYTTAMVEGHRHLRKPKISTEIDRLKAEQANELKLDVRDVLQKYIDIAFADITDYVVFGNRESPMRDQYTGEILTDENGEQIMDTHSYVDLNESDEVDGTIITEVKQGRDGISVKLADKMKALEMLSKYFDLLSDNDKRRLQEEKLKAEIAKVKGEEMDEYEDDGFIEALGDAAVEVWDDDDSDDGSAETEEA